MAYRNTLILISDDCPTGIGQDPSRGKDILTRAEIEYNILTSAPYTYTHEDLTYEVHVRHRSQTADEPLTRDEFHSKGHPCMRASPLVKRYGWGAHYDDQGCIAIYGAETARYAELASSITTLKGMRNKRASA